jgi:hypothetical protein
MVRLTLRKRCEISLAAYAQFREEGKQSFDDLLVAVVETFALP